MRNDYFTLCELAGVVRADSQRVRHIMLADDGFPYSQVGLKYVIPKAQFFRWYDAHKDDDALRYRFDVGSIEAARDEYIKHRLDNRIRRRTSL